MIPVAPNHPRNVIDRYVLPRQIADMLPTRDLFEDEESHFVACIDKMSRLRVVRRAHDIAVHHVAQDIRVAALAASRHCLPDKGKRLMAIEPSQLDYLAVQFEPVI